jgi:hypothetical protein
MNHIKMPVTRFGPLKCCFENRCPVYVVLFFVTFSNFNLAKEVIKE